MHHCVPRFDSLRGRDISSGREMIFDLNLHFKRKYLEKKIEKNNRSWIYVYIYKCWAIFASFIMGHVYYGNEYIMERE